MKIQVNQGAIEVVTGDLCLEETAAIVNAANNYLWMGSGVAGAIKRAGGSDIEKEATAKAPVEVGKSVATAAGTLRTKHVIHAVVMGQSLHTDESRIRSATRSALMLAEEMRLDSISLPALGTGVGVFSIHHCARIMIEETVSFLAGTTGVKLVRFVLLDAERTKAFDDELQLQFSTKRRQ